jgi:mannose-6-phosphate isomerase-like protein (cupin superfamily)
MPADRGWRVARLDEIASQQGPEYWQQWARDAEYGRRWRSVGHHFGIAGFGVNANEANEGEELVVPHEEVSFASQEELYLVHRGRARFRCDGEEVEVGEGEVLYVPAAVEREATALATPTVVFMVGGTPGEPYSQGWE